MALLARTVRALEAIAPLTLADAAWDNVGVLVEAPPSTARATASRVLLTVDLTAETLAEAVRDARVGVVVAYHPALFRAVRRLTLSDPRTGLALQAAAAGISVVSPHSALDACAGGMNDWLAYGVSRLHPAGSGSVPYAVLAAWATGASAAAVSAGGRVRPVSGATAAAVVQAGAGTGRLLELDEALAVDEVVRRVKAWLGLRHVRLALPPGSDASTQMVRTIGICVGSGSSVLRDVQADLYLTGELSHHEVLAAVAAGTSVILTEHSNSERGYLGGTLAHKLAELLTDGGPAVEVVVSKEDREPLHV
ncbi:NGG1 interacting factor, partial [Cladochytrium tenue]